MAHEGGFLAEDQYETVLVIEEANEVLTGNDCAGTGGGQTFGMSGQSEFEQILDQSAGYGLFIMAITQKIADMPSSIIANSGLVFAGRLKRTDDINVVVRTLDVKSVSMTVIWSNGFLEVLQAGLYARLLEHLTLRMQNRSWYRSAG